MLLALDTSTRSVGIALYDGIQVLGEVIWQSRDYHTIELAPAVHDLLVRTSTSKVQLKAVSVAIGPGSFTGLRIGMALAKGLALNHQLDIIGIPTLDILAAAQPFLCDHMVVTLRAGRGRLAVGWYEAKSNVWTKNGDVEVMSAADLNQRIEGRTYICGELTEAERRLLGRKYKSVILASPALCVRRPGFLAELGWRRWQMGDIDDAATLSPIYLHQNVPIPN